MKERKWILRVGKIFFLAFLSIAFCVSVGAAEKTYHPKVEPSFSLAGNFNLESYSSFSNPNKYGDFRLFPTIEENNGIGEERFSLRRIDPSFSMTQRPETLSEELEQRMRLKKLDDSLFTASLVSLVALNVSDYLTTRKALTYEGLEEANPLMKPFVQNDLTFAAWKAGLTAANVYLLKKLHSQNRALGWVISLVSQAVLSYVVVHNMEMIHQAQER